ncbi:hypothetical protein Chor_001371 [Crotalus horridus]
MAIILPADGLRQHSENRGLKKSFKLDQPLLGFMSGKLWAVISSIILGQRFQKPHNGSSTKSKRKRVFMASGIGTNVTVAAGDTLRIGCPIYPSANNTIRWFVRNHSIEGASDFKHKTLVGGRILEFIVASDQLAGQYKCWASSLVKPLSVWVNVKKEEYRWKLSEQSPCSTTCGNSGSRFQKFVCVNMKDQNVNTSLCKDHQKPIMNNPRSCKIQDCPASWATTAWSECSASCGHGFHRRRIACKQVKASRRVLTLSPDACADQERPLEMKPCVGHFCAEWIVHPWGQCTGRCINLRVGLQHRRIQCQHQNGSAVLNSLCDSTKRSLASVPCRLRKWLPVTTGQLCTQEKEEIGGRSVLCMEEETHYLETLQCHFL